MSGDRLAHLEHVARDPKTFSTMVVLAPNLYGSDLLVLVEIAKAARAVLRIVDRDTLEVNALRSALARLDSGATEGDAWGNEALQHVELGGAA